MDSTDHDVLEQKLHCSDGSPISLPFEFLKEITCNFSDKHVLGKGGYGVVYKGVLRSGKIIAVKKLFEMHLVDDDQFQKEVSNLMGIKHQNVVQLVGYCAESRWEAVKLPSGNHAMAQLPTRLLCFEYVCERSLDKHVSDESSGLDWNKRYEIIKGICSGLHFLHQECHIVHLDLKPENILMDATMMPKIADFGLSKLLGAQKSQTIINGNLAGSLGYMAPEYMFRGIVSAKADIFSFGVIIIEIITGRKDYPMSTVGYFQQFNENGSHQNTDTSLLKYTEKVVGTWRDVFSNEPKYTSPEMCTEQVKQCITIALECLDHESTRRPNACDLFRMLTGEINCCQKRQLLNAEPFQLRFDRRTGSCSLHLTNNTDHTVAFRILKNNLERYFPGRLCGIVLPSSIYTVEVKLMGIPSENDNHLTLKLQSTIAADQSQMPEDSAKDYSRFFMEAKRKGREVQNVKLPILIVR